MKNPKMIGQVAKCPKCDSMVMIAAPSQVKVENQSGQSVDSMALTKDGIQSGLDESLLAAGPDSTDDYRLSPVDGSLVGTNSDGGPGEDELERPDFTTAEVDGSAWQPEVPLIPSDEWTSEDSARRKQYLLVVGLAAVGLVFCVLGFFLFMNWYGNEGEQGGGAGLAMAGTEEATSVEVNAGSGIEQTDPVTVDVNSDQADAVALDGTPSGDSNLVIDSNDDTTQGDKDSSVPPDEIPVGGEMNDIPAPAEVVAAMGEGGDDFEPDDPFGTGEEDVVEPLTEAERAAQALPNARMATFAPMLDWQVVPTIPENGLPLEPPPLTAEDLGIKSSVTLDPVPAVDWLELSKTQVPGLIYGGLQRTAQAVNLWSHASGVPTRVDLDSLAAANLDRNKSIKVPPLVRKALGETARELAFQIGATVEPKENRYVEFAAEEKQLAELLPQTISIAPWTAEGTQDWLVSALENAFPNTAKRWLIEGDELKREPQNLEAVTWFRGIRLIENLRIRLGAEPVLSDYSTQSLAIPFIRANQIASMKKTFESVSIQSRPFGQEIARLSAERGIHVWFDWPALGQIGVGPMTEGVVVTQGRTLTQILRNYADKFSLSISVLDSQTLWVTSPRAYRSQPRVFVLPSQGRTAEQWMQELETLTPLSDQGVGDLWCVLTPDAKHVVVRCCAPDLNF
ncbi:MAG: hypothetical protein AB8B50_02390 [Pirellulaceae bacterium]